MAGANETYTIDIKAALPDGENVTAKLNSLSDALLGANKSADYFDAALSQVTDALAAAKAASADADDELAKGNELWRELEANANRAAKAFEKAATKGPVTKDIADQATATKAALDAYAVTLEGLEKKSKDAATSEKALAAFMGKVRQAAADARKPADAARESAAELGNLRGSLQALPGPLGKLANAALGPAQGFQKLTAGVGASNAAALLAVTGYVALAAAVVAVTVALAAAIVKVAAWGVSLADASRNAALSTEAFNAMNPALASLDFAGLAKETGESAVDLQKIAKSLADAGVAADATSVKVAGLAEHFSAATGGSAHYLELAKAAKDAQKAVDDAAKKSGGIVDKKLTAKLDEATAALGDFELRAQAGLGGVVARQAMGLDAQIERLDSNISGLFDGLKIEPLLEGLSTLVALFDENTAAGEALKFLFETVFQPLIDWAAKATTAIEAFYLGFLIGAMKLYLEIQPAIKAVKEFFGIKDDKTETNFKAITEAGKYLAYALAALAVAVGVTLVGALMLVAPAVAVVVGAFYAIVAAVKAVIAINVFFYHTFMDVVAYLKSIDLASIGRAIVQGLINGITGGYSAAVNAVKNVVAGAISAAKSLLGIASPSKVFASIGEDTAEGFAGGVEESTDAAHGAIATMASPSAAMDQAALSGDVGTLQRLQGLDAAAAPAAPVVAPAASAEAGGAAGAAGARTVTLYNPVIQLGAGTPKEQAEEFVTWITELLEGDAAQAAGA